ncbi:MAG: sulfurtransferase [Verrucomicrobia bacterium]|nr:sulfurtransferase [Verrucomicrobiota bacterium]
MSAIVNVSAYRFVPLDDLERRRDTLQALAEASDLRGTLLLSSEGINLFVAGTREGVDRFLAALRALAPFTDLETKESPATIRPFRRLRVKVKREIIACGAPGIDPARDPAPRVSPEELRAWLDAGEDVILLDTRNDYEVQLGTFRRAQHLALRTFRDLPEAVTRLPAAWQAARVVTFCTGGIRCEKAAPLLRKAGFADVYQLDGGILRYFERCGGAHYDGECFVFDERVGLLPDLTPSGATLCARCQRPIPRAEQAEPGGAAPAEGCRVCRAEPPATPQRSQRDTSENTW